MDRATALDALHTAAVDVLSVQADQVTEQASFADDLDADSLDLVELVMSSRTRSTSPSTRTTSARSAPSATPST